MNVAQLPEGYREIKTVDLLNNKKEMLTVNLAALLLGAVMVLPAALLVPFHAYHKELLYNIFVPLLFLAALFLYILLHEAVHGVFMKKLSNVKPYFGFKGLMYAYAGSTAFFRQTQLYAHSDDACCFAGACIASGQSPAACGVVLVCVHHSDCKYIRGSRRYLCNEYHS